MKLKTNKRYQSHLMGKKQTNFLANSIHIQAQIKINMCTQDSNMGPSASTCTTFMYPPMCTTCPSRNYQIFLFHFLHYLRLSYVFYLLVYYLCLSLEYKLCVFHWNISSIITETLSVLFIATSLAPKIEPGTQCTQEQISNLYKNSLFEPTSSYTHTTVYIPLPGSGLELYIIDIGTNSFQCLLSLTYILGWAPLLFGRVLAYCNFTNPLGCKEHPIQSPNSKEIQRGCFLSLRSHGGLRQNRHQDSGSGPLSPILGVANSKINKVQAGNINE